MFLLSSVKTGGFRCFLLVSSSFVDRGRKEKERKKKKKSIAKESVLVFRIFGLFRDVYDMFRAK